MTENKKRTPSPKIDAAREWLIAAGPRGLTWKDYADLTDAHHGSASGMLSRLHKDGDALRLTEKRNGQSVYVAPHFRDDRDIVPPRETRRPVAPPDAAGSPDLEAIRRDAYAEGVAAGRAHERRAAETRELEHAQELHVAFLRGVERGEGNLVAARDEAHAEGVTQGMEDIVAAETKAFAEGRAQGLVEGKAAASSTKDSEANYQEGFRAGRRNAEVQWQEGYDAGIAVGAEEATAALKRRLVDAGGEPYLKGREVGRREGEEMVRRRALKVAGELSRTIKDGSSIRSHFKGCYKQHPECAVKALMQAIGVPPDRLKSEVYSGVA